MTRFASVISMSPAYVQRHEVWVLEGGGEVLGFYGLIHHGEVCELDQMWLLPRHIGKGHGRRLFEHARDRAREGGAARLEWQAERHAIGFYQRMGARHLRWAISQLGRRASVMGIRLVADRRDPAQPTPS